MTVNDAASAGLPRDSEWSQAVTCTSRDAVGTMG
jgi:hypothetical protein